MSILYLGIASLADIFWFWATRASIRHHAEIYTNGNSDHFTRYTPTQIEYGISRYQNETRRLYSVIDTHLSANKIPYLTGSKCTIADIAHWGWVASAGWSGVDIDEFPALKEWEDRMAARPGVEKGRHVPDPHKIKELLKDRAKMERHATESRAWVQAGMEDAKKGAGQK